MSNTNFDFNVASPWSEIKRVALNPDGTIYKYHNPNITGDENEAFFEDGTTMPWADYENQGLNCMVEIPKFYYCKKKIGDNWIFGIADKPVNTEKVFIYEWKVHPAFYRCRDKLCNDLSGVAIEVDHRYAPAFLGSIDSQGRLRSLPFKLPQTDISLIDSRIASTNTGNGWSVLDYNLYYAIQLLYITEYGHADSQTKIGKGFVSSSAKTFTGGTLQYGNKTFGETTGTQQMSYRGIEDLWGNTSYWIDGLVTKNYKVLIGNKGFNNAGDGYKDCGNALTSNLAAWIGDIHHHPECGFIMGRGGGSNSSKLYDFSSISSTALPAGGSHWEINLEAGMFNFICIYTNSTIQENIACSLAY